MKITTKEELNELDYEVFRPYTKGLENSYDWLYSDHQHYRLLSWFSLQFHNETITDLGTYRGLSALAMSYNESNTVKTYDIDDANIWGLIKDRQNIEFIKGDCNEFIENIVKTPLIFLDIDPHDGFQEKRFYDLLVENGYQGILIMDDIHYRPMIENFIRFVDHKIINVTDLGHGTGTGIIEFK